MKPFAQAMKWLAEYEGGYADRPLSHDPGGPTNRGITQRTYSSWLKANGRPDKKVINLTEHEYDSIYSTNYWRPLYTLEKMPALRMCVFDAAVHSGPNRAIKLLQRAVGAKVDGIIGVETLSKANRIGIVDMYCEERLAFLKRLKNWPHNARGWEIRVNKVNKRCTAYEMGDIIEGSSVDVSEQKAIQSATPAIEKERTKPMQSSTVKAALTTVLSSGGGMLTAIAALDGAVQLALVGVFGVGMLAALWVYRERMLKWEDGDR